MQKTETFYHGYRFPPAVISQPVHWHFRFQLGLRDIEELLYERDFVVRHRSVAQLPSSQS